MKKIVILVVLLGICVSTSQAQQKVEPSAAVASKFNEQFPGASGVRWTKKDNVLGASFTYRNDFSIAYFGEDGELIARGRNISDSQLPISVQEELMQIKNQREKKYGAFDIGSTYEFSRAGETQYIVTLENKKLSLLLVSESGRMTVRKKTDKGAVEANMSLMAKLPSK